MADAVDPNLINATTMDFSSIPKGFENANAYAVKALELENQREALRAKFAQQQIQRDALNGQIVKTDMNYVSSILNAPPKSNERKALIKKWSLLRQSAGKPLSDGVIGAMETEDLGGDFYKAMEHLKSLPVEQQIEAAPTVVGALSDDNYREYLKLASSTKQRGQMLEFLNKKEEGVNKRFKEGQETSKSQFGSRESRIKEGALQKQFLDVNTKFLEAEKPFIALETLIPRAIKEGASAEAVQQQFLKAIGDSRVAVGEQAWIKSVGSLQQRAQAILQKAQKGGLTPTIAKQFQNAVNDMKGATYNIFKQQYNPLIQRAMRIGKDQLVAGEYISPENAKKLGYKMIKGKPQGDEMADKKKMALETLQSSFQQQEIDDLLQELKNAKDKNQFKQEFGLTDEELGALEDMGD